MERKIVEQFVLGKGFNAVCRDLGVGSFFDAVRKVLQAYHTANDKYPQTLDEINPCSALKWISQNMIIILKMAP